MNDNNNKKRKLLDECKKTTESQTNYSPIRITLNNVASGEDLTASNKIANQPEFQDSSPGTTSVEFQIQSNDNIPAILINELEETPKPLRGSLSYDSEVKSLKKTISKNEKELTESSSNIEKLTNAKDKLEIEAKTSQASFDTEQKQRVYFEGECEKLNLLLEASAKDSEMHTKTSSLILTKNPVKQQQQQASTPGNIRKLGAIIKERYNEIEDDYNNDDDDVDDDSIRKHQFNEKV